MHGPRQAGASGRDGTMDDVTEPRAADEPDLRPSGGPETAPTLVFDA